jgi:hypothetical protein
MQRRKVPSESLAAASAFIPYIKTGTVLFPRSGCEQILGQMFNLAVQSTTTWLIQGLMPRA